MAALAWGSTSYGGLWIAAAELGLARDRLQGRGCGRWAQLGTMSLRTGEAGAGRRPEASCARRVDTVSTDPVARDLGPPDLGLSTHASDSHFSDLGLQPLNHDWGSQVPGALGAIRHLHRTKASMGQPELAGRSSKPGALSVHPSASTPPHGRGSGHSPRTPLLCSDPRFPLALHGGVVVPLFQTSACGSRINSPDPDHGPSAFEI